MNNNIGAAIGVLGFVLVIGLAACKPNPAPVVQAPIESPIQQVTETIVTPKPIMVEEKRPQAKQKGIATPRLDTLEKRVKAIEDKITRYERQYGQ